MGGASWPTTAPGAAACLDGESGGEGEACRRFADRAGKGIVGIGEENSRTGQRGRGRRRSNTRGGSAASSGRSWTFVPSTTTTATYGWSDSVTSAQASPPPRSTGRSGSSTRLPLDLERGPMAGGRGGGRVRGSEGLAHKRTGYRSRSSGTSPGCVTRSSRRPGPHRRTCARYSVVHWSAYDSDLVASMFEKVDEEEPFNATELLARHVFSREAQAMVVIS